MLSDGKPQATTLPIIFMTSEQSEPIIFMTSEQSDAKSGFLNANE